MTTFTYNNAGDLATITDPAGRVTQLRYDAMGREIERILNDVGSSSSSSSSSSSGSSGGDCDQSDDSNLAIRRTYAPDGGLATLVVVNAKTGDQTTTFTYGTTLADSDIATSNLKRSETYADSVGGSDQILYCYNRQSEVTQTVDQNGTVHVFDRDKLGRVIHDRVTVLGSGVDGAVRRISTTYDVLGRKSKITSWNNADVNSGDIVNEVQFVYNNFGQIITDYQSHGGEVNISTTPKVQYGFANGSTNTIRPTSITCPDGRVVTFDYCDSGSMPDACSRVDSIKEDFYKLVQYSYLGQKTFVAADYPQPGVKWTLSNLSGTNDPDTGDIYSGFDRFGRIKDNRWYNYNTSTDVERIKHGYDRAGNRLYRQNVVATAYGVAFDEMYSYDRVNRLREMQRGTLNGTQTALLSPVFTECWSMDSTANWSGYRRGVDHGNWNLVQQRNVNEVNELVSFANSVGAAWATPAYDPAGNMTTFPKTSDPSTAQTAVYDAWNRLIEVSEGANTVASYQYDGANRRTIQQSYSSGTLTETRHYYYTTPGQWQVIEERIDTATVAERQFVWGLRFIDDLVLRDRDTDADSVLDERLYALQDANWNVTAILESTSDVQERYAYSPYGVPMFLTGTFGSRSNSDFDWRDLFTGRRLDAETGVYDFRNRPLSSTVGLFLTRDPLGFTDGPNLYTAWFVPATVDPYGQDMYTKWDGTHMNVYFEITDPCGLKGTYTIHTGFFGKGVNWENNPTGAVTGVQGIIELIVVEGPLKPPAGSQVTKGNQADAIRLLKFIQSLTDQNICDAIIKKIKTGTQTEIKGKDSCKTYSLKTQCLTFGVACTDVYYGGKIVTEFPVVPPSSSGMAMAGCYVRFKKCELAEQADKFPIPTPTPPTPTHPQVPPKNLPAPVMP